MRRLAVFGLCILAACSSNDEDLEPGNTFQEACAQVEGCETPKIRYDGPQVTIWRVLVERDESGEIAIKAISEADVPMVNGPPPGPLGGTHGLAALDDGGEILEVQRIRFPEVMLDEGFDPDFQTELTDLSNQSVDTMGYLEVSSDVATIAVIDARGGVVTSMSAPAPGSSPKLGDGATGTSGSGLTQAAPGGPCNHVAILGLDDLDLYPQSLRETEPLQEPTPTQIAVTRAAFGTMTPMLCAGVSRVAFAAFDLVRVGGRHTRAGIIGDLIRINSAFMIETGGFDEASLQDAGQRARLLHTVIHESGHAVNDLLDGVREDRALQSMWVPRARTIGAQTVDRVRLRAGLATEWLRMHTSFVDEGFALPYTGEVTPELRATLTAETPEQLVRRGAMSGYGATNLRDDFTEFVTWPVSAPYYEAAGVPLGFTPSRNDFGCVELSAHTEASVPGRLAAVYTKLLFAKDLGLIPEGDLMRCRGNSIDLPVTNEGFNVYQGGDFRRSFTGDPAGRIYDDGGDWKFEMTASGRAGFGDMEYDGELKLTLYILDGSSFFFGDTPLDLVPWPRGIYALGDVISENTFELDLPDAAAGSFIVSDGFALVAEASNDRIVGSVFVKQVRRPFAPSPLPVYDNYDPPLQFRFLLSN